MMTVRTAQYVADVFALRLFELGWQERHPHEFGPFVQNPRRDFSSFFASPVAVRNENNFHTCEERSKFLRQAARVHSARKQAKAMKSCRVFRALHEVPEFARLG